jgi:dTDP-4-amino-4,6-dideoxygalactose transaminase
MKVNFLDLKVQYENIKDEVNNAIQDVIDNTAFVAGKFVKEFEENFAKAHNTKYCVGVNSGTSALHISLMAHNIGPGDEGIVPTNTFFATAEAVSLTGASPIFVDCNRYANIDVDKIEDVITDRTVAIIPVHLYGQPAQMDEVVKIANKHNLIVIEDCAQAHLSKYKGTSVGNFGNCGCFSFYPGKNLGAYGEAGAVVTNDKHLYDILMALRDHGSPKKYTHNFIGHNYRMEGIQGAVLNVKLKYLDSWTIARNLNVMIYKELLNGMSQVEFIPTLNDVVHSYHLFVIKCRDRDKLATFLSDNGIYTGIHYPIPCHKQQAYKGYNDINLPIAEDLASNIISLPMFPELEAEEIKYVVGKIKEFYKEY